MILHLGECMLSLKLTIQGSSENPKCSIVWIEPGSFKFETFEAARNGNIVSCVCLQLRSILFHTRYTLAG